MCKFHSMSFSICMNNTIMSGYLVVQRSSLQLRHDECDGVLNHQYHDCLLNRAPGLCEGNSPVFGGFPS